MKLAIKFWLILLLLLNYTNPVSLSPGRLRTMSQIFCALFVTKPESKYSIVQLHNHLHGQLYGQSEKISGRTFYFTSTHSQIAIQLTDSDHPIHYLKQLGLGHMMFTNIPCHQMQCMLISVYYSINSTYVHSLCINPLDTVHHHCACDRGYEEDSLSTKFSS